MNDRPPPIGLRVEGRLDTERRRDGDRRGRGCSPADGVADQTPLVLIRGEEVGLPEVGGDVHRAPRGRLVEDDERPLHRRTQSPSQLRRAGRDVDIRHPPDVLEPIGAAAIVRSHDSVVADRMEIGPRNPEIELRPLRVIRPPRGEVLSSPVVSPENVGEREVFATVTELVTDRALVHRYQSPACLDERADGGRRLVAQAGGIGKNEDAILLQRLGILEVGLDDDVEGEVILHHRPEDTDRRFHVGRHPPLTGLELSDVGSVDTAADPGAERHLGAGSGEAVEESAALADEHRRPLQ